MFNKESIISNSRKYLEKLVSRTTPVAKYAVIDLETTGFECYAEFIEIAIAHITIHSASDGSYLLSVSRPYHKYFLPNVPINPNAEKVHGLSISRLKKDYGVKELTPTDIEEMQVHLNLPVLHWSNNYDNRVFVNTVCNCRDISPAWLADIQWYSAMTEIAEVLNNTDKNGNPKKTLSLKDACHRLGVIYKTDTAHSATYDVDLVIKILERICVIANLSLTTGSK